LLCLKKWWPFSIGHFYLFLLCAFVFGFTPIIGSKYFVNSYYANKELYVLLVASLAILSINFVVPKFNKISVLLLLAILSSLLFNYIILPSELSSITQILIFLLLYLLFISILYKFNDFQINNFIFWITFVFLAPLIFSTTQLFYYLIYDKPMYGHLSKLVIFSGAFGNINIFAQFIGLGGICALYSFISQKNKYKRYFSLFIFCWAISLVYLSACRSASIGIFFSTLLMFIYFRLKIIKIVTFILLSIIFYKNVTPQISTNYKKIIRAGVQSSANSRYALWGASFEMLKSKPLGIGFGQFNNNTYPFRYQGRNYFSPYFNARSPHNEFIRIATEGGIILLVLLLVFFSYQLALYLKCLFRGAIKKNDVFVISLMGFIFIEMMLQFPFEMIYPLIALAFCIAYMTYRNFGLKMYVLSNNLKMIKVSALIMFLFFFLLNNFVSKKVDYYLGDFTTWSCKNRLINSKRCLTFLQSIAVNYRVQSNEILNKLIYYQPYNIYLVQEKIQRQLIEGYKKEACMGYSYNQEIFRGSYSIFPKMKEICKDVKSSESGSAINIISNWILHSSLKIHPSYLVTK